MTALEESMQTCSRCGCNGYLHREDEVVRSCQLARLRSALIDCVTAMTVMRLGATDLDKENLDRTIAQAKALLASVQEERRELAREAAQP